MRKTFFLNFASSASEVHKTGTLAGEAVKQRLLAAEAYDLVVVTYCSRTSYKYEVRFNVTKTYIIVNSPPITIYMEKAVLNDVDCQIYLHKLVRSALEM